MIDDTKRPLARPAARPAGAARTRAGAIWQTLAGNPLLALSMRRGMRRGTTFALQLTYVLALAALVGLLYLFVFTSSPAGEEPGQKMGRLLFLWLGLLQTFFLSLSGAVLAGSSIALEREQRSYEALRLTLLSPLEILTGKYLSILFLLCLLIVISVPIACLGFLFGGVSPAEVARVTLLTLLSTAASVAVGLACSAYCRRSALAIVLAATLAMFGLLGIPFSFIGYGALTSMGGQEMERTLFWLVLLNPLFAEGHLFFPVRRVPTFAPDGTLLSMTLVLIAAWFTALRRLRRGDEE